MEKKPRAGEVEDAGPEAAFQLIGQGALAVVVAAGGGDVCQRKVAVRTCAVTRSTGRARSAEGTPDSPSRTSLRASSMVVPSIAVTSRPFHSRADAEVAASVTSGVELEDLLHGLLAEQLPGLRQRGASGRSRARLELQTRQPGRRRQHRVPSPAPGNSARDQHADHGHLRVQHPVPAYVCPEGASRSARAITSSASSSSSRPSPAQVQPTTSRPGTRARRDPSRPM